MNVFLSGTKRDLDRQRRKQPPNLRLDVIKKSVPLVHLSKEEHVNIVNYFKDLYQEYRFNGQRDLVIVQDMDAAELSPTIINYAQHLSGVSTLTQKTSDESAWSLVQSQTKLKSRMEEIAVLKEQVAKKTPRSKETLTPLLEQAQK